jgi:hypothetical protein
VDDIDSHSSRYEPAAYLVEQFEARWAALLETGALLMRLAKRSRAKKASTSEESPSAEECN